MYYWLLKTFFVTIKLYSLWFANKYLQDEHVMTVFLNGPYIGRNKEGTVRFRGGKMCVTGLDGSSNLFVSSDVWSWRGILVKLVMHQISVDEIENPCYWINRCRFDMVIPSILSTQYWASLIFSPSIVIGKIDHFCVPRGQRRFFIKIEAKASICSWEVCFCCCTH